MPKKLVSSALLVITLTVSVFSESVPPALVPPAGLDSTVVPMFISLGFDDNKYADGVDWASTELLQGRFNHAGAGNKATYDGSPMEVDFYIIANADYGWSDDPFNQPVPSERPVTESWVRAYESGSGINGHTFTHNYNLYDLNYDTDNGERPSQLKELGTCTKYLINVAGIPHSQIFGFRTPYLACATDGSSFKATAELGMLYDCTLDNGVQGTVQLWAQPRWPGTMENGWIWAHYSAQNLWQVPNGVYPTQEGAQFSVLGFDSGTKNGWPTGISGEGLFNQMKWAIEHHYNRNRAPIDLGLHSDYYSQEADETSGTAANAFSTPLAERRSALIMLLDWIESDLPDARVVKKIDIIRWMRNPVALTDLSRNDELTYKTDNPSGGLSGGTAIKEGSSTASVNANGEVDVTIVDTQDWQLNSYAGIEYSLIDNLSGAHSIKITYSSTVPLEIRLNQSNLNGDDYQFGLSATNGSSKTVELLLNSDMFMQPRPRTTEAALDLSKVTAISVVGTAFDSTVSGTFKAQVEVYGAGQITADVGINDAKKDFISNAICLNEIKNNSLNISSKLAGTYNIEIFGLNGQKISSLTTNLKIGINVIPTKNISTGCHIVKVSNKNYSVKRSLIFN